MTPPQQDECLYWAGVPYDVQGLDRNTHYRNSDGDIIHGPARRLDGAVPAGASAQCRDRTYSFSRHANGTCSHHGGVQTWMR
jgi:hypothetical protein